MKPIFITLKILLPFRIFAEQNQVRRIVAETRQGAIGFLPRRLDCVAALVPGILFYESAADGERYLALDEGVLVKSGTEVLISVRDAIAGPDLSQLRDAVERQFMTRNEDERNLRSAIARLESGFVRRLSEIHHE